MERIAILGHSFVARLEEDLRMDGQLQFNKDLDLPSNYMVKFFGLRGTTTHRILYSGQFQDCEKFHPTRVFLQIGENDIGSALSNIDVIQGIRRVVDSLLSFSDVKRVIVGSLFQRTNPRGLTAEDYNSRVDQINIFLQRFYAESKSVSEDLWGQHGTSGQVMEFTSTCLPQENMQPKLEWRLNVNSLDNLMFRIRLCELFLVNSSEMSLNDDLIVFSSYEWQINVRLVKDKRFILNLFFMLNKKKNENCL